MSDLKPCPFCGGEAQTTLRNIGDSGEDFWSVECFDHECGCDFCLYTTEAEAIEAWNTRAELAIAATLGSDDRYDAGFSNGVQAVFQQLEGIEDYEQLQDLIAEYWAEGEGNNEHINALDRCKRGSDNRCIRNGFTTGGW